MTHCLYSRVQSDKIGPYSELDFALIQNSRIGKLRLSDTKMKISVDLGLHNQLSTSLADSTNILTRIQLL